MKVSGQPQASAILPPRKEPPVPTGQEAVWAPEPVWTLWREEKSLALSGIEPCFFGRPIHYLVAALIKQV
jgi:hypothetical protein